MSSPSKNDVDLEFLVGAVLRTGVLAASAVVTLGGAIYLRRHGFEKPAYHLFLGEPSAFSTIHGVVRTALSLEGRGVIQLGLLLLIATPVIRVVMAIAAFFKERDFLYAFVSVVVFGFLLYGLIMK